MSDLLDQLSPQTDALRGTVTQAAQSLRDFTRRLELILSQEHKNIPVRDEAFAAEFTQFCTQLRQETDGIMNSWLQLRTSLRQSPAKEEVPSSLLAKSFTLRAKTLSNACDDFTTAYDRFCAVYKRYTSVKLPVWVLTACCEDMNNLTGKILFLTREINKKVQ